MTIDRSRRRTLPGAILWTGAVLGCGTLASVAGEGPQGGPIELNSHAPVEHRAPIDKQELAPGSQVPMAGTHVSYATPDNAVRVGVWESEPGTLKLDMPIIEYIHIVQGATVISDVAGHSWTYKAGDSFVLPQGFKGTARIVNHFKKEFVDVRPSAAAEQH